MNNQRVFLSLHAAHDSGDDRHAQVIMRELAARHGFQIVQAIPQSLFDGWEFVVETERAVAWPPFVRELPPLEVDVPGIV